MANPDQREDRLARAAAEGAFGDAEALTLWNAPSALPLGRLEVPVAGIVHRMAPEVEAWEARGFAVETEAGPSDAVVVFLPRSKAYARELIAEAARLARFVIVDGQKTDGADSLFREVRALVPDAESLTKAHGRVFWFAGGSDLSGLIDADWASPEGFRTYPGVFSEREIDPASKMLAAALPDALPERMADFGAGWGYLAQAVLAREGVATLDLVEADARALDAARENVEDPRARFIWADVVSYQAEMRYDGIVMNPPFHSGRDADMDLGQNFLRAAARNLKPKGSLWLVANRHLPYEAVLEQEFRQVKELAGDTRFKVIFAGLPKTKVKKRAS